MGSLKRLIQNISLADLNSDEKPQKNRANEKKKGWMSFSANKGTTKVPTRQKASREEQPKGLTGQSRDAKGHTITGMA